MTGRIPFSEIKSGPAVIIAVSQNKRIPEISELQEKPQSARAILMHGILLRCWRYEPDKRATANAVKSMVRLLHGGRAVSHIVACRWNFLDRLELHVGALEYMHLFSKLVHLEIVFDGFSLYYFM